MEDSRLWTLDDELEPERQAHWFAQELGGFCACDGAFYFAFVDGNKTRFARLTADDRLEPLFDGDAEHRLAPAVQALRAGGHDHDKGWGKIPEMRCRCRKFTGSGLTIAAIRAMIFIIAVKGTQ